MKRNRLLRLAIVLGLAVVGCSERQEELAGPSVENSSAFSGDSGQALAYADKEHNAVDLGTPARSVPMNLGASSSSAFGASATPIPFAPKPGPFNNSFGGCDDCVYQGMPIGFSFAFFGNTYTTFNLSSNGLIGFGAGTGDGCCRGGTIPSSDGLNNIIAAAWTDLEPDGYPYQMFSETRGSAPNRYLVVEYRNVAWYGDPGVPRVTSQIILYESSNFIEIHTTSQSAGHIYTQGVEDATGTQAVFLPGRVAANYGLVNDAVRFTTGSGSWLARAPMPIARRGLSVAGATGVLYAIGGNSGPGTAVTAVQAYNTGTNFWSTKAPLPAARQNGNGATTISGKIYVAGGQDAAQVLTRSLYMYNTSTNLWAIKANMPAFGGCGGSARIDGYLYVFSGCTRSSTGAQIASALLHRYDPATNTWLTLRPGPAAHFQPVVAATGGKLYVVGGNNNAGVTTNRLDVYDPASNSWTTRANMPTARVGAGGSVAQGKLFVMGGRIGTTYLTQVEAYDPVSNSWSSRALLPTARAALGVGVVDNQIYAIGGRNSAGVFTVNERFTP
jgi:N-acetylneuraminic acid mutarotase